MPYTKRSDLIIPELLVEAIQGEFTGKNLLYGTPVAVVSNTLPGDRRKGDKVKVPYFGTMGEMEDIVNEGDALTPEKLSESFEEATVRHSGKAFERTEWARLAAQDDPYPEAARQFGVIARRRADKGLIDVATDGMPSEYINDVSAVGAGTINYDHMVDSVGAWGDEQEAIRLLGVHSKVYRDLLKLKDGMNRPLLVIPTTDADVPRFMGVPVYVSDKCKKIDVNGDGSLWHYESLIIKEASLAFWYQSTPRVLTDSDALADSELAAIHMYWVAHRYMRVRGGTKPGVVKLITK